MAGIRCYLPAGAWKDGVVRLLGPEAHHLRDVLRVRTGDEVTCFDGQGRSAQGTVQKITRSDLMLTLGHPRAIPPPRFPITLAAAIPKQDLFNSIIDQATQMGVSSILPVVSERVVVKISPGDAHRKLERWKKISMTAGKQSGAIRIPEILPMTPWKQIPRLFQAYSRVLIAAIEGPHEPLEEILSGKDLRSVLLLIGPEGDFTPEELEEADRGGAHRFSLGSTVLRCDTAVVAALSLVFHCLRRGGAG